jgi:methylmalonyl-CoA epimerase
MAWLNHIGIATNQLPLLKNLFHILDLDIDQSERVSEQGVDAHFVTLKTDSSGGAGHLEFLEAFDPQSAIAQFINKRGPGIHHLSFEVEKGKLDDVSARLRQAHYRLIYDQPRMGAHQMRVNFIHPSTAGGLLIEIMERS